MTLKHAVLTALCLCGFCFSCPAQAQPPRSISGDVANYRIMVYQDAHVSARLKEKWSEQVENLAGGQARRGFLGDLFAVTKNSSYGLLTTGVTGLVTSGVNLVGNLFKSKKNEWRQVVQKENRFEKQLMMLENLDDFYSELSTSGAMDPGSMTFNGFGCLQKRGNDTVLYVSCHLDTTEVAFSRILRHSKFELTLDTLVFNPVKCDLPNDSSSLYSERPAFSFEQRQDLNLRIDVDVLSSWINQAVQVYNEQPLGHFYIQTPIDKSRLDTDGVFRYVRGRSGSDRVCDIVGECFIVPRSYMGVRDASGNFHDAWGTGQYKLRMSIKETCNITPAFESDWKTDWRRRKRKERRPFDLVRSIRQVWDKNAGQWVVTILEAPASYATQEMFQSLGLVSPVQQAAAGMSGQKGTGTLPQHGGAQSAGKPGAAHGGQSPAQGGGGTPPLRP